MAETINMTDEPICRLERCISHPTREKCFHCSSFFFFLICLLRFDSGIINDVCLCKLSRLKSIRILNRSLRIWHIIQLFENARCALLKQTAVAQVPACLQQTAPKIVIRPLLTQLESLHIFSIICLAEVENNL